MSLLGQRVAISGGNWIRQLPHWWLDRAVRKWDRQRQAPLVFYFTSWELDPEQPQVTAASALSRIRQYRNLGRTRLLFERYMQRYRFVSIAEHLGVPLQLAPAAAARAVVPPTEIAADAVSVAVVVPIYNEQDSIPYLLRTMETVRQRAAGKYRLELVLVDDCSRDDSWALLQRAASDRSDISVVRHEQNRGVAAAIMTGLRSTSAEVACSIDCDCSYDPMEILQMVPLLDGADMVTASPYHPEGQVLNVPRWRLSLSRSLSWIYRRLLGADLHTWTSCFRVYRRSKVADLQLEHGGFLGVAELLIRLVRRGGKVREYPTLLESRLLGVSKMKTARTIRGHLGLIWEVLRRRVH
jgi:hypothetical protein